MDYKFAAVVGRAEDYKDYDKLLRLITPSGVISAVVKGVKRPQAKLRFAAMPFAFCEFVASSKGSGFCVVTGASPLEDLFAVCSSPESLTAASVVAEVALASFGEFSESNNSRDRFVFLLHRLKDIVCGSSHAYLQAIRFLQYIIHDSGYGYEYVKVEGAVDTPLKVLCALHFDEVFEASDSLIARTLKKLVANFENKFDCVLNSKKMI